MEAGFFNHGTDFTWNRFVTGTNALQAGVTCILIENTQHYYGATFECY